ncbi:MAG TPA: hypothetical protein DEQ09_01385 [Bacteroidales bacterium]|nr:hypothetical protein [Bacteroidales bacterium]
MKRYVLLFSAIAFLLNSCLPECEEYTEGILPLTPLNMEEFNSEYDDYNATAPSLGAFIPFCFSTNRNSEGENFDIIYMPMSVHWDKATGDINILNDYDSWIGYQEQFTVLNDALNMANTDSSELGPNLILNSSYYYGDYDFLIMYASDKGGDFQICFTYNYNSPLFNEPKEISYLNSEYDDLYPTFNSNYSHIYFCSARDNDVFNIYSTPLLKNPDRLVEEFNDTSRRDITLNDILSSDYNDKCPFIMGRVMVFTSDRPGGEGGFDLYYSIYEDNTWGEPVNFGPYINSPDDEYRPVLVNDGVDFYRDMMIFSSDRQGGSGGFDLYYVGVEF